jgi:hypothetical protein
MKLGEIFNIYHTQSTIPLGLASCSGPKRVHRRNVLDALDREYSKALKERDAMAEEYGWKPGSPQGGPEFGKFIAAFDDYLSQDVDLGVPLPLFTWDEFSPGTNDAQERALETCGIIITKKAPEGEGEKP